MPEAPEVRVYHFPDEDLKQAADQCILNVHRDIAGFIIRGVTTATVEDFEELLDEFVALPADDELIDELAVAAENKDAGAILLRKQIRRIRSVAHDKYGAKGRYLSFGFEGLDKLSDNDLYRLGGRVVRVGTTLQPELETNGLTSNLLTDLAALTKSFDDLINEQLSAIENRDLFSQARINAGNAVYTELARLCNIGKHLFRDIDEAKYKDYVIIDTLPGSATIATEAPAA